jgi:sterol desaturase/sphingolipid hydroxylase (fatty acid hydroxylase superfamily)
MGGPEHLAAFAQSKQLWLLAGVFAAAALIEAWRPERTRILPRGWRWATNLCLHLFGQWLFLAMFPASIAVWFLLAIGGPHVAAFAPVGAWGGAWAVLVAALVLLDLVSYLQHRLMHGFFLLWRMHSVHHSDIDVDAATAVRHHPFEVVFSGMTVVLLMLVIGMPPWASPIYATLALALQLAQHANLRLPARLDAAFGLVLMTPGLHRTHHAVTPEFYNSNFGTVLSVWDRFFRTLAPPLPEQNPPGFGVAPFLAERYAHPHWALLLPFVIRADEPAERYSPPAGESSTARRRASILPR